MAHVSVLLAQPPLAAVVLVPGLQAAAGLLTELAADVLSAGTVPACHVTASRAPLSARSARDAGMPTCGAPYHFNSRRGTFPSAQEPSAMLHLSTNDVSVGPGSIAAASTPFAPAAAAARSPFSPCAHTHDPRSPYPLPMAPGGGHHVPYNHPPPMAPRRLGFSRTTIPALHSARQDGGSRSGGSSSGHSIWRSSSAGGSASPSYSPDSSGGTSEATAPGLVLDRGPASRFAGSLPRGLSFGAGTDFLLRRRHAAQTPLYGSQYPQQQEQMGSPVLQPRRGYQAMTAALRAEIQAAAAKKQTGVSLKHLLDFGNQPLERQMLLSARFLHSELPIRLAHRLMDLNHLPSKLSDEPHVRRVKGWYAESFSEFRTFPPIKDNMDVVRFTSMLKNAVRRHNNVVPAIAKGVEVYKRELERTGESTEQRENEIQHFLDTFFLSRIAIRFLAGHHISMFDPPRPGHIGLVHTLCSPFTVATDAVSTARSMCFREYGNAPQVTVLGNRDLTMAYVPSHLHHMVFELVKNSLRAVQERFSDSDAEPPAIQVVVADGLEDVTIKVSDQGGGIPRSGLKRIWTYLYTTARSPLPDVDIDSSNMPAVLAGYGCGLPLSRLYARYFGGDLQIISMEGYGTDAYLHLARLGNDEEPLPGAV